MIKCPHCGKSHYREDYMTSTAMGWSPIVKDGVRYDEDPNIHTTHCTCLECGGEFTFDNRGDISKGRTGEEIKKLQETSYTDISLNEKSYTNNLSFDTSTLINNDEWKDYQWKWVISDKVENIKIQYKGITYKFNLEKVLKLLVDVVEETTIINN